METAKTGTVKSDNSRILFCTFRDYVSVLFRQKRSILNVVMLVVLGVLTVFTLMTPVYEARVKMLITAGKPVQALYDRDWARGQNVQAALTQGEIVKSTPVLERAVEALELHKRPFGYEQRFAAPLKDALIAIRGIIKNAQLRQYSPVQQQAILFRDALESLRQRISIQPIPHTDLFLIEVRDFDPVAAATTANIVSRSYIIFDLEQQLAELILRYGEVPHQVQQLENHIRKMSVNLGGKPVSNIDAIGPANVKIIEQATVPLQPAGPNKSIIVVVSLLAGFILGCGLAFISEFIDPTFKSPQEVERELKLSFLGSIPLQQPGGHELIPPDMKRGLTIQFYQILADQIYLLIQDKRLSTLQITSPTNIEGSDKVTANLGLTLAQRTGKKVAIIDANLHNPTFQKIFQLENRKGLAEVLEGKVPAEQALVEVRPNLHVMSAGQTDTNSVILFDTSPLEQILNELHKQYKIILVHCPNLRSFRDAVVVGSHTSATLMVVRESVTRRQVVKRALYSFSERDVNILGVILNDRTFPIPKFVYDRV